MFELAEQPGVSVLAADVVSQTNVKVAIGVAAISAVATLVVGVLTFLTQRRQLRLLRSTQITDRFTNAINQLGSGNKAIRIGGIFALEQLARESARDRPTIAYTLATFVRDSQPAAADLKPSYVRMLKIRAPDVQAAVMVLCRSPLCDHRKNASIADLRDLNRTDLRLDLSRTDLRRASLSGANLDGVNLWGSRLEGANLRNARLRAAGLSDANLGLFDPGNTKYKVGADLREADLTGAFVVSADLRKADLTGAVLTDADLSKADLTGALLDEVKGLDHAKNTDRAHGLPTQRTVPDRASS